MKRDHTEQNPNEPAGIPSLYPRRNSLEKRSLTFIENLDSIPLAMVQEHASINDEQRGYDEGTRERRVLDKYAELKMKNPRAALAIWLKYVEGVTEKKIAEEMGVNQSRVSQIIGDGLDFLGRKKKKRNPRTPHQQIDPSRSNGANTTAT